VLPLRDNIDRRRPPLVTAVLVGLNLLICLLSLRHGEGLPAGDLVQLLADSLLLWLFGPSVEDWAGRLRFLALYLLGGLAAAALTALLDPGARMTTAAATGALATILGAHLALYPRARMLSVGVIPFFFTLFEMPTFVVIALWLLLQLGLAAASLVAPLGGGQLQWLLYGSWLLLAAGLVATIARGRPRPTALGS
jgi:membrane associated rhomboid family serine protease